MNQYLKYQIKSYISLFYLCSVTILFLSVHTIFSIGCEISEKMAHFKSVYINIVNDIVWGRHLESRIFIIAIHMLEKSSLTYDVYQLWFKY